MKALGLFLVITGVGSFILPLFGWQFSIMRLFGNSPLAGGIIMTVVGIVLLVLPARKRNKESNP